MMVCKICGTKICPECAGSRGRTLGTCDEKECQDTATIESIKAGIARSITVEPGKRSGKPCIRGTRMAVSDVLEYLASGMTEEEILHDFPDLTHDDIQACLAFKGEAPE